jgi:signal transduction histidine kinase
MRNHQDDHSASRSGDDLRLPAFPGKYKHGIKLGLEAKLVVGFMLMLILAVGGGSWFYLSHTRDRLSDLLGEQARQLATSLAMGGEVAVRQRDIAELNRFGQNLVRSRNILYVTFYDPSGTPLATGSRDLDFKPGEMRAGENITHSLMQVRRKSSRAFGEYLDVSVPVLSSPLPGELAPQQAARGERQRLLGYVAVGVSPAGEMAQLNRIGLMILASSCAIVLGSLPVVYLLVKRIFVPIRALVDATRRISSGDLDARVAIDRPDGIGELARSFNEMAHRVRQQQEELESTNAKLAAANVDLEAKVRARTAQVELASRRLVSEIEEKEEFIRAVSHDLNAPLRNISGMVTMLLMKHRKSLDADVVERLERIKKNVDVESDLINELLELSRIKTRRQKLEPVELEKLIWDLRGVFENDLKQQGIELILESQLPVVRCERVRMRQVFQNLIDNAIKYMGSKPHREIRIGCNVGSSEAEFYVRDTGVGVDPDELDRIFLVFRRGRSGTGAGIPGKGVGLASVKSIVQTYNGKIWAESTPGQGTTVRFTINGQFIPSIAAPGSVTEAELETISTAA